MSSCICNRNVVAIPKVLFKTKTGMELTINHQIYFFDQELSSLEELVLFKTKGQIKGVAVALNQRVIPKSQWSETKLNNQDNILLLTATQGG